MFSEVHSREAAPMGSLVDALRLQDVVIPPGH